MCVGKRSAVDTWAHLIALGPVYHLETALIRGWLLAQDPSLSTFSFALSLSIFFLPLPLSLALLGRQEEARLSGRLPYAFPFLPSGMPDSSSALYKTCQDPLWANTGQAGREEQPPWDVIIPGEIAALASGCSWAIHCNRHWEQSARKGYLRKPFCQAQG